LNSHRTQCTLYHRPAVPPSRG